MEADLKRRQDEVDRYRRQRKKDQCQSFDLKSSDDNDSDHHDVTENIRDLEPEEMFGNKARRDREREERDREQRERDERIKRLHEEQDRLKAIEREQGLRLK